MLTRRQPKWPQWVESQLGPDPAPQVLGAGLRVTLVNHATLLVQGGGLNILTDPHWGLRCSPVSWAGPKRVRSAGIALHQLPKIDVILLSHNHYDHMDLSTLERIAKKWDPPIYAGLGNAEYLKGKGFARAIDMDWWDRVEKDGIAILCAPGQHFSSRALSDRNKTLWCGFVIETPHGDLYFAGDTGYGEFVARIKERYPRGFRLAMLPIGAFRPEWFMGPVHISPEQAVTIYDEISATTAIGIHHSTFHLADDGQDEPKARIDTIRTERDDARFDFRVPENGAVYEID
jgi:L-ascorbate metabolism protein UlaG (beta-lactamase superfamily)